MEKIEAKKVYIKITLEESNPFIEKPENMREVINNMVAYTEDTGEIEKYTFETCLLTQSEFEALPDFTGF